MSERTEKAILAGGCFWGMQDLIRKRPGVLSTRVGYTGGDVPNATYRNHGTHAEAIEITFDPEQTSYRDLLEFFFQIHDPTTLDRQGNDIGKSYRSAIFYVDDEQRRVAEDTIADVEASGLWPGKVVTEVSPAGPFWEAEPEHQDYLEHYPERLHLPLPAARTGCCPDEVTRSRSEGNGVIVIAGVLIIAVFIWAIANGGSSITGMVVADAACTSGRAAGHEGLSWCVVPS